MSEHPGTNERQLEKLRRELGEVFLAALVDPETVEILLNPDSRNSAESGRNPVAGAAWGKTRSDRLDDAYES
jgi:hypothetical protein